MTTSTGGSTVRWITAFLDTSGDRAAGAERFWSGVTGHTVSDRRGSSDEFATLLPAQGEPHLKLQIVGTAPAGGLHLDLHADDVEALGRRAGTLGATVAPHESGYAVCTSPGGLTFCIVGHLTPGGPSPAATWPGGRSAVDQVCLDIPPGRWDAECSFWAGLTGWPWFEVGAGHPEFRRLRPPLGQPLQVLLQRLDDDQPTVTAHLDLAADDRDAEVARHLALGATGPERHDWWTSLHDPSGRVYCVTRRRPAGT